MKWIFSFIEGVNNSFFLETRLTVVSFLKPLNFSKPGYLSQADVRIVDLTLASPSGRRIERKLLSNLDESCLLVWWSLGDQKVYPWAPQLEVHFILSLSFLYTILNSFLEPIRSLGRTINIFRR